MSDAEIALEELRRKYKIMEGNRKSYVEDAQNHIRRQRQTIDKLKFDNSQLKNELSEELKDASLNPAPSTQAEILRLADFADLYTRKIEMERRRVEELDQHLALSDAKIVEQRRAMGGANASKEGDVAIAKQVKVLETKLDRTLTQFNEALARNKVLRADIDNLRLERMNFDAVYRKMEKELAAKKREMSNIIEISNVSYEARDQAHNEIASLRAMGDKEQSAFDAEMRELAGILEYDRKMKEARMRNKLKAAELGLQFSEDGEESKLNKKGIKGNWGVDGGSKAIQVYEEAFKQIQEATGMTDIDDLVTSFIAAEDQNFSLFNFVNELNQETEKLEETAADLRSEIRKFSGSDSIADEQRKQMVKELELKINRTDANTAQYERRTEATARTVNALRVGLKSMYDKLGCDNESNRELLGDEGVTDSNMLTYLGVVEQRAGEVMQMYAAASTGHDQTAIREMLGSTGPLTPGKFGSTMSIVPPSTAAEERDGSESEEEIDDRPLTREELQAKTMRRLNKRESRGQARRKRK